MKKMEWISTKTLPVIKGFYYCFIPECKEYHKHIAEFYFDGVDFRDGNSWPFFGNGRMGGKKITDYITYYMII